MEDLKHINDIIIGLMDEQETEGYHRGYDEAWDEARNKGYDEGFDAGREVAINNAERVGADIGFDEAITSVLNMIQPMNFIITPENQKEYQHLMELHGSNPGMVLGLTLNHLRRSIEKESERRYETN